MMWTRRRKVRSAKEWTKVGRGMEVSNWHRWFAWRPVIVKMDVRSSETVYYWAWLESVWRKSTRHWGGYSNDDWYTHEYKPGRRVVI